MVGPRLFKDDKPPRQGAIRHTAPKSIGKEKKMYTLKNFDQIMLLQIRNWGQP